MATEESGASFDHSWLIRAIDDTCDPDMKVNFDITGNMIEYTIGQPSQLLYDLADFTSGNCSTTVDVAVVGFPARPARYSYDIVGRDATLISPYKERFTETKGTIELFIHTDDALDRGLDNVTVTFKTARSAYDSSTVH